MGYAIQSLSSQEFALVFDDQPAYCQALPMAPAKMESELRQGLWIILLVAVWSASDIRSIEVALSVAKEGDGKIQFGIRPFLDYEENKKWCSELKENLITPIWLVIRDGKQLDEKRGWRTPEQILEWVKPFIP